MNGDVDPEMWLIYGGRRRVASDKHGDERIWSFGHLVI